jgi:hypothetical protein
MLLRRWCAQLYPPRLARCKRISQRVAVRSPFHPERESARGAGGSAQRWPVRRSPESRPAGARTSVDGLALGRKEACQRWWEAGRCEAATRRSERDEIWLPRRQSCQPTINFMRRACRIGGHAPGPSGGRVSFPIVRIPTAIRPGGIGDIQDLDAVAERGPRSGPASLDDLQTRPYLLVGRRAAGPAGGSS